MVALAAELKKQEPAFAGLKLYHCPMAPKPGLWMQLEAPLRNPFFGARMLTCGEEWKGEPAHSMPDAKQLAGKSHGKQATEQE